MFYSPEAGGSQQVSNGPVFARSNRMNADTKMWKEVAGFLDEGTGMTGELHFTGRLRLDGEFHGSIFTDGTLVVGEKASVRGDIKVSEIEIAGHIFGNIEASTRVEILDTGRVQGDVQTPLLVMKPGSMLDGRTSMDSLTPYTPTDQADN